MSRLDIFVQGFTLSVHDWYFSCLLVFPIPRWCFAAFLGWMITFWDDVSFHLGHSHHTPSPLPLRLPLTLLCCRHVLWQCWLRGKRDRGILAAVPVRLQMPLPQQWEFSGSHPQGMHFQMAQLAGRSDLSPWGLNRCQALRRTRFCTVLQQSVQKKRTVWWTVCAGVNKDYPFWVWEGFPHSFYNRNWTFLSCNCFVFLEQWISSNSIFVNIKFKGFLFFTYNFILLSFPLSIR